MRNDGSGSAGDDPVFVLCAGRSGSTLLRFLLDAHPDLACPPETRLPWLARQLATAWAVIEDAGSSGQSANGSSADAAISAPVAAGLRRSLDPMMTSYLRRRGKRRYCDKSLGAAQHAGLLLKIWPQARFICLYRHPMDVIASGIEASPWGLTSYGFEPYIGSPPDNNVAALARYWLDYTTSIVAAEEHFTDRCLPVRYEDLVTDPDGQIARIFEFIGATPAPGIVARCFGPGHQRFGPGDYKIWNTGGVSADSVGRGWTMPAGKIPASVLGRVNELADVLGYVRVGDQWGTGAKPADLRARRDGPPPAADGPSGQAPAALPQWAVAVDERVRAGMARVGDQFGRAHGSRASESVLLFVNAPAWADADAWWRLDLAAGTFTAGLGEAGAAADWSLTGSAPAWDRLLTGQANLGVAFRRGDLRYADKGDAGAGSTGADSRVAALTDLLGLARWVAARLGRLELVAVPGVAAAAQVALELAGDRVTGRLGQVGRVLGLLERAHVLGHVRVLLGELVHAAFPGPGLLRQVPLRERHVEHVLDRAQQRQRDLRRRRLGDVVRRRRPQRDGRDAGLGAGVLQDPDDPGGALVVVRLGAHPAQQLRVRAADLDRNRAGVRRVGQQRPDQDEQFNPELGQPADKLVGEPAPAHVRLDAVHEHDVAGQAGGRTPGEGEPGGRPDQALGLPRHHVDHRPVDLEVVEVIGVDRGYGGGLPRDAEVVDHSAGRFGRVVPSLERGDRHRVDERSFDVAELDDFTSA
jgi:Sulfotransferase family